VAFVQAHFFSEVLGLSVQADVVLPQRTRGQIGMAGAARDDERHPVLFLLHGLSDDHSIWMRRTSIERYASEVGLAVVMPAVHRSFYADQVTGYRYWTYVSEELPDLVRGFFPLSDRREDTFVAGLSMGGYGAMKWALRRPGSVAAAVSLSGALDVASLELGDELTATFGDRERLRRDGNDLLDLVAHADPAALPRLRAWCGTEDDLLGHNRRFRDAALAAGVALRYDEGPGGHDWARWDEQIRDVVDWLPVRR
jgi:S-formylglutathione hydrolase FrmB